MNHSLGGFSGNATRRSTKPVAERNRARALRIVDERHGEHGGGAKPEGVPTFWSREHERAAIEKRPQDLFVERRHRAEPAFLQTREQPVGKRYELPLVDQVLDEPGRIRAPGSQVPRAVHAAGFEVGLTHRV